MFSSPFVVFVLFVVNFCCNTDNLSQVKQLRLDHYNYGVQRNAMQLSPKSFSDGGGLILAEDQL